MFARTLPSSLAAGFLLFGLASSANAHIELIEPVARYEIVGSDTGIKSCPCGLGGSNRTCNVAADGSDPDRSTDRVSQFEAGSTIKLRFEEYVDHTGSFRVAFDPDGADMADFNSNILVPIVADPSNVTGNVDDGAIWEIEVTLPDMTCDNCTLQLIQAMHGDTVNPVADPAPLSTYYTCIDVELVPAGTLGTNEPGSDNGAGGPMTPAPDGNGEAPEDDSMGLGMVPAMGDDTGGQTSMMLGSGNPVGSSSTPGSGNPMGNGQIDNTPGAPVPSSMSSGSSGGCSVAAAPQGAFALLGIAGLCAALSARRRTRR